MTVERTVDDILRELEDSMHFHLDQPLTGDFVSLTRAWREILTGASDSEKSPDLFILPIQRGNRS